MLNVRSVSHVMQFKKQQNNRKNELVKKQYINLSVSNMKGNTEQEVKTVPLIFA